MGRILKEALIEDDVPALEDLPELTDAEKAGFERLCKHGMGRGVECPWCGDLDAPKPRAMRVDPDAEENLRQLWDVPEGVDVALFEASQARDPVVAESHLAEARDLLTEDDPPEFDPLEFDPLEGF